MRTTDSEVVVGNDGIREQEKSSTPTIPLTVDDKSRFLKKRNKKNATNNYHPSHNPRSVAKIPDYVETAAVEEDKDAPLLWNTKRDVSDEDIRRLKQELVHLPFDTVLRILSMNSHDVDATIELGKQMEMPDLVPQYLKDYCVANIAVERNANPTRGSVFKRFYFAKDLRKVVDTRALVDFYYHEKNKIGGNWRLDRPETQLSEEEKTELEDKLKRNNISILVRDPSIPVKQKRAQKAAAARKANQLKKEVNGEGSQDKDTDSDSISVSSTETPSTSDIRSFSAPASSSSTSGPFRHRDMPPASKLTSLGLNGSSKTILRGKSIDEKPIGPRRSYPGRLRRPPTFFE